jgi:3-oxoacyl-[acyl-carrier-protein] synthase II
MSPLGKNTMQTVASLKAGLDCVSPVTQFDVSRTKSSTAGQVPDEYLKAIASESRKTRRMHRASHMMIAATREALSQLTGFVPQLAVIGTTSGGMSYGESFFKSYLNHGSRRKNAEWLANYSPQKQVLDALDSVNLSAPCQIIANACASGSNAIGHAFQMVRSGKYDRVLCGGYDAISEMVFTGFDSLQAATPEKIRPFDKDRTGLVLGEGAAILALEPWDEAQRSGKRIVGEITGYGISTDNHHLTQPHPSGIGPFQAMSRALASAGRMPDDIDYINAHGTATIFNDATEGVAITQLFPSGKPVSSTKSMMGHSLGAAGAIEAVFCILALEHQFLPPNINFRAPDPAWNFEVVANEAREAHLKRVISNSFGFGGTNASIVIEGGPQPE